MDANGMIKELNGSNFNVNIGYTINILDTGDTADKI